MKLRRLHQKTVKIGQAAKVLGVSIKTLRYWEKAGKIHPIRTPGNTRLYSLEQLQVRAFKKTPLKTWHIKPEKFYSQKPAGLCIPHQAYTLVAITLTSLVLTFGLTTPNLQTYQLTQIKPSVLAASTSPNPLFHALQNIGLGFFVPSDNQATNEKRQEISEEETKIEELSQKLDSLSASLSAAALAKTDSAPTYTLDAIRYTLASGTTYTDLIGKTIIDSGGNIYPANSVTATVGTTNSHYAAIYANGLYAYGSAQLGNTSSDTVKIVGRLNNDLIPSGNGDQSLGDSDHYWKKGYINTITSDTGGFTSLSVGANFTSAATTVNLINTTATTLNIGGAATTVSLGASTGTTTINNNLSVTGSITGDLTGDITGNADTATALAANPTDCASNNFAISIAASGNLTCAAVTYAGITEMSSANLASIITDETGTAGKVVFDTGPTISNPVITNISPGADFTLTQNSVTPFVSINTGAVTNTLYLRTGNVGIGTTAPGSELEIYSADSSFSGAKFSSSTAGTTYSVGVGDGTPYNDALIFISNTTQYAFMNSSGNWGYGFAGIPGSRLSASGNLSLGSSYVTIAAPTNGAIIEGNVGIGTTNPGALVDIGLAGTTLGVIRLEGSTSGYAALQPTAAAGDVTITLPATTGTVALAGDTMYIGTTAHTLNRASAAEGLAGITSLTPGADFTLTQNSVAVLTSVNTSAVANTLYLSAGNVGIGTTEPGALLDVRGGAIFNEASGDFDFRIESNDVANMFVLDAGNNSVTIGDVASAENFFSITPNARSGRPHVPAVSVEAHTFTDNNTAESGTAALYQNVFIAQPTLAATNASVTTTDAATLRIAGPPSSSSNETLTNAYGLMIASADVTGTGAVTNSYGLAVAAASGATNNYSAIFTGGNVGIGTTAPGYIFDVQAAAARTQVKSTTGTNAAFSQWNNTGGYLYVGLENSTGGGYVTTDGMPYAGVIDVTGAYPLQFATTDSVRMTIAAGGNVGIGTTDPGYKLEVVGTVYPTASIANAADNLLRMTATADVQSGIEFYQSTSTGRGALAAQSTSGASTQAGSAGDILLYAANNLVITTGGILKANERMRITSGGNVGIGTTNPTQPLTLALTDGKGISLGDRLTNGTLWIGRTTDDAFGASPAIGFLTTSTYKNSIVFHTAEYDTVVGEGERMRITPTGNVGIGTTNPGVKLDVEGTAECDGAGCWAVESDIAYKTNIRVLDYGLAEILRLSPKRYTLISSGEESMGMIAQEFELVIPELVHGTNGSKNIGYDGLAPVFVNAIQQQQVQINDLIARITDIEATSSASPLDDLVAEASTSSATTFSSVEISESLQALDATISGTLKSLGDTFLGNTLIAGDLIVDGTLSLTGDSISSIGTLYLQSNPLSTLIDIFNGKVQIDNSGKVSMQKLAVSSDVLGTATIPAGESLIVITSDQLTEQSKVFITPHRPVVIAVTERDPVSRTFTVELGSTQPQDIEFDWFLVDERE